MHRRLHQRGVVKLTISAHPIRDLTVWTSREIVIGSWFEQFLGYPTAMTAFTRCHIVLVRVVGGLWLGCWVYLLLTLLILARVHHIVVVYEASVHYELLIEEITIAPKLNTIYMLKSLLII